MLCQKKKQINKKPKISEKQKNSNPTHLAKPSFIPSPQFSCEKSFSPAAIFIIFIISTLVHSPFLSENSAKKKKTTNKMGTSLLVFPVQLFFRKNAKNAQAHTKLILPFFFSFHFLSPFLCQLSLASAQKNKKK